MWNRGRVILGWSWKKNESWGGSVLVEAAGWWEKKELTLICLALSNDIIVVNCEVQRQLNSM